MTALNTNANELYSHLNSDEGHRSADYNLKRTVQTSLAPIERRRSRKIIHIVCVKKNGRILDDTLDRKNYCLYKF